MLDKLWDDVVAGPQPEKGLKKLRQIVSSKPLSINGDVGEAGVGEGSKPSPASMKPTTLTPITPATPGTPSGSTPRDKHNVWRSVFNPGSNLATKGIGADIFDKPQPNSPTVYDWLYSGETRSTHR